MSNSVQRALVRFAAVLLTWTSAYGIIHAQRPAASALDLVNSPGALTSDEVQVVLERVRASAAGKAFHLGLRPDLPGGPELVMGANGRPEWVRTTSGYDFGSSGGVVRSADGTITREPSQTGHVDLITITHYTTQLALRCDGTALNQALIIQYEHRDPPNQWTAIARTRKVVEELSPPFDILAGAVAAQSGERRAIGDHTARGLVGPYVLAPGASGGPPAGTTQTLWVDTVSLLPVAWSLTVPGLTDRAQGPIVVYPVGLTFVEDPSVVIQPPDGVAAPDCVR